MTTGASADAELTKGGKDGSQNWGVFAHLIGQIFADIGTSSFCFVCEEPKTAIINPLATSCS